jgi:tetratricopeptide (TPR) repeat protein
MRRAQKSHQNHRKHRSTRASVGPVHEANDWVKRFTRSAVAEAVKAYQDALEERTRARVPLDWAATQNNLGTALQALGEGEGGTAWLEEAVTAYREALEALKENTPAREPLEWAMIQMNLGAALGALGERESGTARLEESVAAFREALKELSVPLAGFYSAVDSRSSAFRRPESVASPRNSGAPRAPRHAKPR